MARAAVDAEDDSAPDDLIVTMMENPPASIQSGQGRY